MHLASRNTTRLHHIGDAQRPPQVFVDAFSVRTGQVNAARHDPRLTIGMVLPAESEAIKSGVS
jgi:hypothetical protein